MRQQVVAMLGRRDVLTTNGELDNVLRSLARFSDTLRAADAFRLGGLQARTAARGDRPRFSGGKGTNGFLGLCEARRKTGGSGSTWSGRSSRSPCSAVPARNGSSGQQPGPDRRGRGFRGFSTPARSPDLRFPWQSPRKPRKEDVLPESGSDLRRARLVVHRPTSLYLRRDTEIRWCKRGYSRDRRGGLPQIVLCVAMDRMSWPVARGISPETRRKGAR